MISADAVKELRDKTGVSVMQCKKALEEAGGDIEKAVQILASQSALIAKKKSDRTLGAGAIAAYVHAGNQIGAMVLLSCETDFVSKNPDFQKVAYDIAMHVSAMRPETVEDLLAQSFIKDSAKTVQNLVDEASQKFGERVAIAKYGCLSVAD